MVRPDPEKIYQISGALKALNRRGWIKNGCLENESDAEHSWGVAFLAFMYAPRQLDKLKCLKLAIIHDLPEIRSGDIIPADHVAKIDKYEKELAAMRSLSDELECAELTDLFMEFEQGTTPEAAFVHDLDKLDMVMQCRYFIEKGHLKPDAFDEFFSHSYARLKTPFVKELFEQFQIQYKNKGLLK